MRALRSISAAATVMLLSSVGSAAAQQMATQTVTFRVNPISELAISGSPAPIVVDAPRTSERRSYASVGGTSYAITTNEENQKISAALDHPMPNGVELVVALGAPSGATSKGVVTLSTHAADVVTSIPPGAARALPITYTLSASDLARRGASGTRIITYTVTSGL
ncbi:MAG TPA: hypothetical protein VGP25_06810 [Gemmatimonadaceae bacterium]|jgi:hypothetical protein|nr:hypothetical protein [Gemmatimonadaceae bacterium]